MTYKTRKAIRKLDSAFNYLRPQMTGDTLQGVEMNGAALAGREISKAMCLAVGDAQSQRRLSHERTTTIPQ